MLCLDLVLASVLSVQPTDATATPAPAPAPAEPAAAPAEPTPAAPAPAAAPTEPAPTQPEPKHTPTVQVMPLPPEPAAQPAPSPEPPAPSGEPRPSSTAGVSLMALGPTLVLLGVPASLLGNLSWRNGCGPDTRAGVCARGTVGSMGMHALAGAGYGVGIALTGIGAGKRGEWAASTRDIDPGPTLAGGGVLLPLGLIGMVVSRSLFWLPTPKCLEYECVRRYQTYSTLTVGGSALVAAAGAGLLMYGSEVKKGKRRRASLSPQLGRHGAGLSLTGAF